MFKKIQRYLQVDLSYILQGGFWLTIGRGFSIASSLLLAIIVANYVSPEIYGQYKYITGILGLLTIFSLLGMAEAITLAVARGYEGDIIPTIFMKMRWSILGSTVSAVMASYYFIAGNHSLGILFGMSSIALPFFQTPQVVTGLLIGRKFFKELTIIQAVSSIITTITMALVFYLTDSIIIIFTAFLTSYITAQWLSAWYTIRVHKPNKNTESGTTSYGKHLSLVRLTSHISNNLDSILVWHLAGAVPLALYSFATTIPNELFGTIKGLQTLAAPKFALADIETVKKTLPQKAFKLLLLISVIVIAYIFTAPLLFQLFFPQYIEAVVYTQWFSLTFLFLPKNFFYQFLVSKTKTKYIYIIANSTQVVQIILLTLLTYKFQVFGIIAAKILTQIYSTIIVLYFFKKM